MPCWTRCKPAAYLLCSRACPTLLCHPHSPLPWPTIAPSVLIDSRSLSCSAWQGSSSKSAMHGSLANSQWPAMHAGQWAIDPPTALHMGGSGFKRGQGAALAWYGACVVAPLLKPSLVSFTKPHAA